MTELQYVGKPARRVDALEKVMGTAKYIATVGCRGCSTLVVCAARRRMPAS